MPEKAFPEFQAILEQLEVLERELAAAKVELARKDQIIEALQQRLFGSKSERLDPAQLQLLLDEAALGKPAAPTEAGDEPCAPEEPAERKSPRTRR